MRGNFIWSPDTGVTFAPAPEAPESFRDLAHERISTSVEGKLVE